MGELLTVLENKYKTYQEMLKLLQKEQELLISEGGSPELLTVLETLERFVSRIQALERKQRAIVNDLSISRGISVSDISLLRLCSVIEASNAEKLLNVRMKIVKIMEVLRELNARISYLSEKALVYSKKAIEIFVTSGWTYQPNGNLRLDPEALISKRG